MIDLWNQDVFARIPVLEFTHLNSQVTFLSDKHTQMGMFEPIFQEFSHR